MIDHAPVKQSTSTQFRQHVETIAAAPTGHQHAPTIAVVEH
jgi:hypothetical protein